MDSDAVFMLSVTFPYFNLLLPAVTFPFAGVCWGCSVACVVRVAFLGFPWRALFVSTLRGQYRSRAAFPGVAVGGTIVPSSLFCGSV